MRGLNLPNALTLGRIVLALVVGPLIMSESFGARVAAFVVFLVAAISDIVDGRLARSRGLITDFGKLMDPLADKLLLAATFIPFYLLSHGAEPQTPFPWYTGDLPLWIVVVIFGRELFITLFRAWAARRGVVIAAGKEGKLKAVFQSIFIGATIVWYALWVLARSEGWAETRGWDLWVSFHYAVNVVALAIAVLLTVYSLLAYLRGFTKLDLQRKKPA